MNLINEKDGRVQKIARATVKANLTASNKGNGVEITFPEAKPVESSNGLGSGSYLAIMQRMPVINFRIYYTVWEGPITRPWCFYRGSPNCTIHTCLRHHAAGYVNVTLPNIWFFKDPKLTTAFVTKLRRKKSSFPFAFNFFGSAPEMNAISAAKPFGSSIGWPDPYSEETIVKELYVRDDYAPHRNQFKLDGGMTINPSYLDFMEAFYWFDDPGYQSLTGEFMPTPIVAENIDLDRLHFTFDSEAFTGMNKKGVDRVRFETGWPYSPSKGIQGRSGYSVKFIAIRDMGSRYRGNFAIPERDVIDH